MDLDFVSDRQIEAEQKIKNRQPGFWGNILLHKFSKPVVFIAVSLVCLLCTLYICQNGMKGAVTICILLLGAPTVYGVIVHPQFGIMCLFIAAYLLFIPLKMDTGGFPLGTVMDFLESLLILGYFIKQKGDRQWRIYRDPLSIILLVWIGYNILQLVNPASISSMAWLYTVRTTGVIILMYYVFVYQIRDIAFIKLLFKVWLGLALLAAADGYKQENYNYFNFEAQYLYSDPAKFTLLFIDGHMRKFSIFSDPVAFAYNMCTASMICIVFIAGKIKLWKKFILASFVGFYILTMLYSGTRGAFPLIPAALVLFGIMNFNRRILIFSCFAAAGFAALIFVPSTNPNIMRFQTAFKPNNDPSFNLRKMNQARIRPYIQDHPIGGGLGATGQWGQRFAPDSMLANFPPDSGYVRVAVEMGYIGCILLCIVIFIALLQGINNHFLIQDPEIKTYNLAATMVVFILNLGNYPQEAIVQFPSNVIFFLAMALIPVCRRLDREKQKQKLALQ